MKYTFMFDTDPEDPECLSVFIDNGIGAPAEIAGRICYVSIAAGLCDMLNAWPEDKVLALAEGKRNDQP